MKPIPYFFCALLLLSVSVQTLAKDWQSSEIVILISMDGIRWDYPDRAEFSAFERMQKAGLRVRQMYPTFPSNTFPGHVSLATGTLPQYHGIIDNTFYDKARKKVFDKSEAFNWLEAEPLWITAVRQGKRSATYYWLGSEGQWQNRNATYFKAPFKALATEKNKVRQTLQWIDMPVGQRPHLIMTYWHGADGAGHDFGPLHQKVTQALHAQNRYLQNLINAIDERQAWEHITLIVTSDHGMTEKGKNIDLADLFKQGKFEGYYRKSSALAHLNLKKGYNKTEVFRFLKKQKHFDTYYPETMPAAIESNHPTRSGDLVLVAHKGYRFSAAGFYDKFVEMTQGGMHGMSAHSNEDMRSIFFAMGRGVKPGSQLEKVNMIDVAPSVSALLGIEPPKHVHKKAKAFLPNVGE